MNISEFVREEEEEYRRPFNTEKQKAQERIILMKISLSMILQLYPIVVAGVEAAQGLFGKGQGARKKEYVKDLVGASITGLNTASGWTIIDLAAGMLVADHLIEGTVGAMKMKIPAEPRPGTPARESDPDFPSAA